MHASRTKANGSADDSKVSVETGVDSKKETGMKRRFADSIDARNRKLKLDRRGDHKDRRTEAASEYKGPARRKTIDRREKTKDRRRED
jgi:hypothetical protein